MISQWLKVGVFWTARRIGWTLSQWLAAVPGNDEHGDCDHYTPWQSGGQTVAICTKCAGDETETACTARHQEAVEFFKQHYPEDP